MSKDLVSVPVRVVIPADRVEEIKDPRLNPGERLGVLKTITGVEFRKNKNYPAWDRLNARKKITIRLPEEGAMLEHVERRIKEHGSGAKYLAALIEKDMGDV